MPPPEATFGRLPPRGAPPADRRSRIRGGRWVALAAWAGLALGAVAGAWAQGAAAGAPPLVVCMEAANPPLSHLVAGQPRGLDMRIAQAAASMLGRSLKVLPFESQFEMESTLTQEVNALMSAGLCDAASGFPLISGDLGPPGRPTARTPDYPGAKRKRERPFITLQALAGSRAYCAVSLGVVLRDPTPPLASLADLGERRLGVVSGTLGGSVAMVWRSGALRQRLVTLSQNEDILDLLAAPEPRFEAALVPLAMFDGWKLSHPGSPLVAGAWRRPIGVNLGFVTLATATDVRAALDQIIGAALANGQMARWAAEEGMSWIAPIAPDIGPGPGLGDLARLAGD